ncbi:addiction module protein [candidate division KSB1 bacterium]|nr:addiction module protein [candidate division KSB1 bacterium]
MEDEEDLTEAQQRELDRRLEAYQQDPEAGLTWEELKEKIKMLSWLN